MLKSVVITAAVAAAAIAAPAFAQATNVALGKTVTGTAYYDSGSETFTYQNLTDGDLNDSGGRYNWSYWLTPNGQTGTAVIDLGGLYDVSRIYVQNTLNRSYYQDREAAHVDFYSSTVAPTLGLTATYGTFLHGTDFNDARGTGSIPYADFSVGPTIGRYVTVDLTSFYGASGGLNEVQVYGSSVTAVPEPATWAMMLVGFGMVGFGLRRRARQSVRVTYA